MDRDTLVNEIRNCAKMVDECRRLKSHSLTSLYTNLYHGLLVEQARGVTDITLPEPSRFTEVPPHVFGFAYGEIA
jgi:hypothetical protein